MLSRLDNFCRPEPSFWKEISLGSHINSRFHGKLYVQQRGLSGPTTIFSQHGCLCSLGLSHPLQTLSQTRATSLQGSQDPLHRCLKFSRALAKELCGSQFPDTLQPTASPLQGRVELANPHLSQDQHCGVEKVAETQRGRCLAAAPPALLLARSGCRWSSQIQDKSVKVSSWLGSL